MRHDHITNVHSKKRTTFLELKNVVLPTLFKVVNNIFRQAWISPQSGVTMLNDIIDNIEQCGQQNIVNAVFRLFVFTRVNLQQFQEAI